jgi:hypothetical protein
MMIDISVLLNLIIFFFLILSQPQWREVIRQLGQHCASTQTKQRVFNQDLTNAGAI